VREECHDPHTMRRSAQAIPGYVRGSLRGVQIVACPGGILTRSFVARRRILARSVVALCAGAGVSDPRRTIAE